MISSTHQPYLFVAAYVQGRGLHDADPEAAVERTAPPGTWAYNRLDLPTDASRWFLFRDTHVVTQLTVAYVLRNVGFIGVMYHTLSGDFGYRGVNATGVLGIDEFAFGR